MPMSKFIMLKLDGNCHKSILSAGNANYVMSLRFFHPKIFPKVMVSHSCLEEKEEEDGTFIP